MSGGEQYHPLSSSSNNTSNSYQNGGPIIYGIENVSSVDSVRLEPPGPPPEGEPPSPPMSSENSLAGDQPSSSPAYGGGYGSSPIVIMNYQDEPSPATVQRKRMLDSTFLSSSFGDANLRPNVGDPNALSGTVDNLNTTVTKMRILNLCACGAAIFMEIPNLLNKVFTIQPAKAILGGYLTAFAILLCCFELNLPNIGPWIIQYFGFLQHALFRSAVLILMGGLAMGQGGILDILLGFVFIWSAGFTITSYIWYPQYRKQQQEAASAQPQQPLSQDDYDGLYYQAREAAKQYAWTSPRKVAETASLLHSTMARGGGSSGMGGTSQL